MPTSNTIVILKVDFPGIFVNEHFLSGIGVNERLLASQALVRLFIHLVPHVISVLPYSSKRTGIGYRVSLSLNHIDNTLLYFIVIRKMVSVPEPVTVVSRQNLPLKL